MSLVLERTSPGTGGASGRTTCVYPPAHARPSPRLPAGKAHETEGSIRPEVLASLTVGHFRPTNMICYHVIASSTCIDGAGLRVLVTRRGRTDTQSIQPRNPVQTGHIGLTWHLKQRWKSGAVRLRGHTASEAFFYLSDQTGAGLTLRQQPHRHPDSPPASMPSG